MVSIIKKNSKRKEKKKGEKKSKTFKMIPPLECLSTFDLFKASYSHLL